MFEKRKKEIEKLRDSINLLQHLRNIDTQRISELSQLLEQFIIQLGYRKKQVKAHIEIEKIEK